VTQRPLDGASLLAAFDSAEAPSPRDTQYFEMLGSRAIYHAGWKATTNHIGSQIQAERELVPGSHDFESDRWALYRLEDDFSEAHDLAAEDPARLEQLVSLWWAEAGRNQVLPLADGFLQRAVAIVRPQFGFRPRVELVPGPEATSEDALPPLLGGFTVTAELELGREPAEGIIAAMGDWTNGWAIYLLRGRPVAVVNVCGDLERLHSPESLDPGAHALHFEFQRRAEGGGRIVLAARGRALAEAEVAFEPPVRWQIGGAALLVGQDRGFPVCDDYAPPFPFRGGVLRRVVLEVGARLPREARRELAAAFRSE
jgi:arylsulfatase